MLSTLMCDSVSTVLIHTYLYGLLPTHLEPTYQPQFTN